MEPLGPRDRVLVVAGSATTRRALRDAFERAGLTVVEAAGFDEAERRCADRDVVLVVVEPALSEGAEVEALGRLRAATDAAILLPGAGTIPAEATSVLLTAEPSADAVRRFGNLTVDVDARTVAVAGREVNITRKELDLLLVLTSRPGCVWTREDLLAAVWESPQWHDTATLSEHVHRLRRKIHEGPAAPSRIETVRGVGYRFVG